MNRLKPRPRDARAPLTVAKLIRTLASLEWLQLPGARHRRCPACLAQESKHADGCVIAVTLDTDDREQGLNR